MPLDNPGAEADDRANAAEEAQAQPQLTIGAVRDKFPQYHDLSDEQLAQGLHKKFYNDMPFDQFASKIGFKPPAPPYEEDVKAGQLGAQLSQQPPPDNALSRIAGAAVQGGAEGFGGNPVGSVLSDSAQAKLDEIQRQGGWKGTAAQLASTIGTDVGTAGNVLMGGLNAGFGAFQRGVQQTGEEIGQPAMGRDIAAIPESLMGMPEALHGIGDAAKMRALGIEHPPGSGAAIQADIAKARQTAADARTASQPASQTPSAQPIPTEIIRPTQAPITPEQMAQQEEAEGQPPGQPASQTVANPADARERPPSPPASETPANPAAPAGQTELLTGADQQPAAAGPTKSQTPANPASGFVMLSPDQLKVDPERFQFKSSDEKGVTGALSGVTKWEPALANPITAWQDADGNMFVVNGHQRHDLATRAQAAGQPDVQMATRVFREEDGYTPEFMKVLGAYQNIAEGSTSALDAARVLRGKDAIPSEMALPQLPPKSEMYRQAQSLAKLAPNAFGMVENGVVPPAYAAHVGDLITDPKQQEAALGVLVKADPANSNQARLMVQDVKNSGFLDGIEQGGLFGDEAFAKSLVPERAKVLDGSMASLRRTRGLYKAAVEGETELTAAGNQLSTEANVREKANNEQLIELLQRAATTKGPISDALSAAARDLAGGKPRASVQSSFLAAVRKIIASGEDPSLQPRAVYGGAGSAEEAAGLGQARRLPPPPASGPDLFGADQTRPPRAAPEPTVRNDQRQQTMPGMEPSAVQAQASRDAAGPKANQLPADEGLFARPETPQPELPTAAPEPPKSRFAAAGGPTFQDLLHTVPDRMGGHEAAEKWVLDRGKATGNEHMAIVDNKTGEIVHAGTNGKPNFLEFDIGGRDISPDDSYTMHHNHPQNMALSGDDVGMLAWPGAGDIVAHGHGSDTFSASLGDDFRDVRTFDRKKFYDAYTALRQFYENTLGQVSDIVQKTLEQNRRLPITDYNRVVFDATNHLLHKMGVINLTTTRAIPAELAAAIDKAYPGANTRPLPQSVQPADRFSGLRGGVPEGSSAAGAEPVAVAAGAGARGEVPTGTRRDAGPPPRQGQLLEGDKPGLAAPPAQGPLNIPPTPQFDALRDKTGLRRAVDEIKALLSPTSLRGAKPTEAALRQHGAEQAQSYAQSANALQKVRDAVDQLPKDAQIDFTHRMETGQAQATPELDAVATALRQQLDQWARRVQGLGRGYLSNAIQDYMGHVWGNYAEWKANQPTTRTQREMQQQAQAAGQGKTPLTGSGNFLKERTFPTQMDGIKAGLIPVTYNPVDVQLLKLREMQKFYHGVTLADKMKDTGIARYVPAGQERAAYGAGLDKLDDRVFQPRLTGDANPAGFGRLEPGNWYAPEPAARLFNNYMSQGLVSRSTIINGVRQAGNALNSLQLGLSGFHMTFVMLDTMKSQVALGIQQLMRGDFLKGAKSIGVGATPYSLYDTVKQGSKLRSAWLDPQNATPEWQALAQRLNEGGGRISMDQFYRSNAAGPLLHSLGDVTNPSSILGRAKQTFADEPTALRKAIAAPVKMVGRILETINEPLMGALVPRAKLGVFAKMAQDWQDAHPLATPEERSAAMIKAWDSVDNRLGQLVYDNLFWNKIQKDMAFLTTRSVGWNLGTIRELGGGAVDGGKAALDIARGRKPEFTARMAYTIAMPMVTALYGSILNYLATGQAPQSGMDMFFPQTGSKTPQGEPERRNIPGYEKDVIEYTRDFPHNVLPTLLNKTNPLFETGMELYHNQDYYGGIIRDPQRDAAVPAYADYLLNQSIPFSWRGWGRLNAEGAGKMEQALAFWGFQPAPKSITQPQIGEAFQQRQNAKEFRRRAREPERIAPVSKAWNYISGSQQ